MSGQPAYRQEQEMDDEIDLMEYWSVLWRRRRLIIALCLIVVTATLVVSLLVSSYYTSQTVILSTGSEAGGLGAALSALPFAGALGSAAGIQTPADRIMVILKSRTIAEAVIQRFDLLRVFNEQHWNAEKGAWKNPAKPPLLQDAVKKLSDDVTRFSKSKEGAITVAVEWKDPKLAADMANYYVAALASFLNDKSINVTIQVVDRAVPSERKSSPKIIQYLVLAGVSSLFLGVFTVFFLEQLEKSRTRTMGQDRRII